MKRFHVAVAATSLLVGAWCSTAVAGKPAVPVNGAAAKDLDSTPRDLSSPVIVAAGARVLTSDFNPGDVFVAVASGSYHRYTNAGVFVEAITSPYGGYTTGCATDAAGNLFTTNFSSNRVVAFQRTAPHAILLDIATPGVTPPPEDANESLVFDAAGNFLVGHAGGGDDVHRYNAAGTLLNEYDVSTAGADIGSDWIDLAADGCTLHYAGEGRAIHRYDICTNTQLTDFATLPGIGNAYATRLLTNCTGGGVAFTGLLVADGVNIKRLDPSGAVVATYDAPTENSWFALNLDPNGTSFWSGDFVTSHFYRFNIATGAVEIGPISTGTAAFTAFGLCVFGELTSGTEQCTNGIDDNCNGLIDCADPVCASAPSCNNGPPACFLAPSYTSNCTSLQVADGEATDADGDDVNYSWSCVSAIVGAAPSSGTVLGGPGLLDLPDTTFTTSNPCNSSSLCSLTVEDTAGLQAMCSTTVTFDDNIDPTFSQQPPGNTTIGCSTALPLPPTVTASDNCDPTVSVVVNTTPFSGTECAGSFTRTWTATDDCGNDITHIQTIAVADNSDPVFTSSLPGPITISCSTLLPVAPTVTASDNCDSSVTVSVVTSPFQGTECNGTFTRTWTATDDCGNDVSHTQLITVTDNVDPVFTSPLPGPITIACSTALPIAPTMTASDNCDANVTVSVVTSPFQGTECNGSFTRTWTATDDCGNDVSHTQTIAVVDNINPVFTSALPGPITIACSTALPVAPTVTASDNCDSNVTVSLVTGTLLGTECNGTISRTWTATDDCGNDVSHTQTVTVRDGVDPTFDLPLPGNMTVACSTALPPAGVVTASDNCDPSVTVTLVTSALQGTECNGTITRTWTATDDCGNDVSHAQTVTVRDDVDPTFDLPLPTSITIPCSTALPPTPIVTASDNCTGVTVSLVTSPLQGTECNGTITRTWTATDGCGNDVVHTQTITVRDDVNPVFTAPLPGDITITCSTALPTAPVVSATDNCDPSVTVTVVTSGFMGTECDGRFIRTWTATDDCGNAVTHVQNIVVRDTIDPTATALLRPLPATPPGSPTSPAAPRSVCSPRSSREFVVVCAGQDNCDPTVDLNAVLVVTNTSVDTSGQCVSTTAEVTVDCGDIVELRLAAPPCPASSPQSSRPATEVRSDGVTVVIGEVIVLTVTAADDCGNTGVATYNPAEQPSPLCEEPLADGTCCPAIGRPSGGACSVPRCSPVVGPSAPRLAGSAGRR